LRDRLSRLGRRRGGAALLRNGRRRRERDRRWQRLHLNLDATAGRLYADILVAGAFRHPGTNGI